MLLQCNWYVFLSIPIILKYIEVYGLQDNKLFYVMLCHALKIVLS